MGEKRTYTGKELGGYLVGMFGQNLIYNIVATGLYFYFQNVICLPAMALGWIMTIARIWDAINDPMMGTIVDKTKSKWGKCRPYLIIFPAIIGLVTILTFINGNYAVAANLDANKDSIYCPKIDGTYTNILVSRTDDVDSEKIQVLKKVLTSEKSKKFLEENYKGVIVPVF